jgi:hypothetical protein
MAVAAGPDSGTRPTTCRTDKKRTGSVVALKRVKKVFFSAPILSLGLIKKGFVGKIYFVPSSRSANFIDSQFYTHTTKLYTLLFVY